MRFLEYETIMEEMAVVLKDKVMPALEDVEARQQTWAAIGLLDNLASRMRDQDDRLATEVEKLTELVESAPHGVPVDVGMIPETDQPLRLRRMALADCLAGALTELAGREVIDDIDSWLASCGRALLDIEAREMQVMRPTRYFQSMNG